MRRNYFQQRQNKPRRVGTACKGNHNLLVKKAVSYTKSNYAKYRINRFQPSSLTENNEPLVGVIGSAAFQILDFTDLETTTCVSNSLSSVRNLSFFCELRLTALSKLEPKASFRVFVSLPPTNKSRDSSVRIALGYRLDNRGSMVRFSVGAGNFSHHRVQNGSGAHPAYPMGTRGSFLGVKRPGREADH
jgi:hypothetical protein